MLRAASPIDFFTYQFVANPGNPPPPQCLFLGGVLLADAII
jgi:hypothetical protein